MEQQERQLVLNQLDASRDRILRTVEGLSPEQWAFRPGEGRWSIAECLEHIVRVENRVRDLIANKLRDEKAQPEKRLSAEQAKARDAEATKTVLDRSTPRQAPEPVRPTGLWPTPEGLVAEFRQSRSATKEFAASTQDDLRSYFHPHGALGEIDCYQWMILLSLHGACHAEQMEEVKSAPGFPQTTYWSQSQR